MQDKIVVSSFWATVLVIGTLLSPIVTIILNRIFDLVAKRLNNQHERYESFQRYALEAANRKHDAKSNADFQTVTIFIKELLDPRGRRWIYSTKHKKWIWKRPNKALSCFRQWRSKWK